MSRTCSQCVEKSFSLDAENPSGCTQCFCFGRSDKCSQAPYVWTEVNLKFTWYKPHITCGLWVLMHDIITLSVHLGNITHFINVNVFIVCLHILFCEVLHEQ